MRAKGPDRVEAEGGEGEAQLGVPVFVLIDTVDVVNIEACNAYRYACTYLAAMRRSVAIARQSPAPMAAPLMAATTGTGRRRTERNDCACVWVGGMCGYWRGCVCVEARGGCRC